MRTNTKRTFIISNFALIAFFNFSFSQNNSTHFKSDLSFGGTVFSTFLDVSTTQDQFTITSPKNADVRIFGGKAKLGRAMGKSPKKGIMVSISGQQKNDSLFGETTIPMVGKLKFKGILKNEKLSGVFLNTSGTAIGTLNGIPCAQDKIDYSFLSPILLKTIQDNIYSAKFLQTKEGKKFQKDIEKLCTTSHDDIELYFGFSLLAQKLPFSHTYLVIAQDTADDDETTSTQKTVIFEEKNNTTAYLQIKNFSSSQQELAEILPKITANPNYKNLIVDIRNNPGGGIEAAFEFAKHITESDMEVGYFLTNKLDYDGYQPELFNTLPELHPKGTDEFTNELKTSPGAKMIFKKPQNAVFKGNIYLLTNGKSASTCEPIVYSLKKSKRAVIVGENTAGAMLAACSFPVSGKYTVILPIADFYTYDGVRLDKVGVAPDVEVPSEDALNKALELISKG